jgi:predicted nucleic acid-binding protein
VITVLDASVAVKWFVAGEPLRDAAHRVLDDIARAPGSYMVPELFMNEVLAVVSRAPDATAKGVQDLLSFVESLGIARVGNGHELLAKAAQLACEWGLSGYDAVYVALAALSDGVWLTADAKAAAKIRRRAWVRRLA